ncbi:MAG: hypothetical protein IM583_08700 [Pseudanabaena sp. M114S2SP2A07QC]|nr:hypothetical protein [Pseudanabaena sp. M114S2SP2A07QC]
MQIHKKSRGSVCVMQNQLRGVALSLPFTHIPRSPNGSAIAQTPKS